MQPGIMTARVGRDKLHRAFAGIVRGSRTDSPPSYRVSLHIRAGICNSAWLRDLRAAQKKFPAALKSGAKVADNKCSYGGGRPAGEAATMGTINRAAGDS